MIEIIMENSQVLFEQQEQILQRVIREQQAYL